jgi:hypothetical protein
MFADEREPSFVRMCEEGIDCFQIVVLRMYFAYVFFVLGVVVVLAKVACLTGAAEAMIAFCTGATEAIWSEYLSDNKLDSEIRTVNAQLLE